MRTAPVWMEPFGPFQSVSPISDRLLARAFRYFYHPDHLGSTSYVTDARGEVYQHLEYFAFGETFVEEHSNTDRTPYLFNGKGLDEETGLYYYGARYYDARSSVWQSVDPLADEFAGMSPYSYTANNPVNLTDPDGKAPGWPQPNVIPIALSRIKTFGRSQGNYGAMNVYYNLLPRSTPKELFDRAQGIKNADNANKLLGQGNHYALPIISDLINIPISNEKGKILSEASKIDLANKEVQQFKERQNEANILMDNLDIANNTGVFGDNKLDENTILDLTNYSMISKYGDTEQLSGPIYQNLFKGGNSKEYLEKLKGLSEQFKSEFSPVNLNRLDGPPIEDRKRSLKYRFEE